MNELYVELTALLIAVGPSLVFAMTMMETALFIGLLLPAEATVLLAALLAERGVFELEHILLATLGGAFVGDQIGYLLGRHGGGRVAAGRGRLGRLWTRYERSAAALFRRRSAIGISLARFLSFVRTLMPWFAGMSGVPYPRFLVYDLIGVIGWGVGSVAIGYAFGGSLEVIEDWLGGATAVIIGIAVISAFVLARRRRLPGRG